jgi:UPF0716 family protein affecting phage T7 exclusion
MNQANPPTSLLGQILALIAAVVVLVLGFMFSMVLLAVFLVIGLVVGAWFFWRTRHLRKAMREADAMRQPPTDGNVIEGEAIIVEEYRADEKPVPPDDPRRP